MDMTTLFRKTFIVLPLIPNIARLMRLRNHGLSPPLNGLLLSPLWLLLAIASTIMKSNPRVSGIAMQEQIATGSFVRFVLSAKQSLSVTPVLSTTALTFLTPDSSMKRNAPSSRSFLLPTPVLPVPSLRTVQAMKSNAKGLTFLRSILLLKAVYHPCLMVFPASVPSPSRRHVLKTGSEYMKLESWEGRL